MMTGAVEPVPAPEERGEREHQSDLRVLWTAIVLPPLGFLTALALAYALIPASCARDSALLLHLAAVVGLVLTAWPTLLAWRAWQRAGREWPGEDAGAVDRSRFMGSLGAIGGVFFSLMVVTLWVALLIIPHCRR